MGRLLVGETISERPLHRLLLRRLPGMFPSVHMMFLHTLHTTYQQLLQNGNNRLKIISRNIKHTIFSRERQMCKNVSNIEIIPRCAYSSRVSN